MPDARLIVVYDTSGSVTVGPMDSRAKVAFLDLKDGLKDRDVYMLAQKLAEMLLEQLD